jgi:hypothetical protein
LKCFGQCWEPHHRHIFEAGIRGHVRETWAQRRAILDAGAGSKTHRAGAFQIFRSYKNTRQRSMAMAAYITEDLNSFPIHPDLFAQTYFLVFC